jgi:hypothetical protein
MTGGGLRAAAGLILVGDGCGVRDPLTYFAWLTDIVLRFAI